MKIYLVGGAVRDKILNLPIKEKDWVVIGSNINEMLKLGYYQVGKNFPVFINPKSGEEYSLARTDKKIGFGYHGFICSFSNKVSLLEDLYRRDITINAIAEDENGNIIDPYNGINDLNNKVIKHISDKFIDDPLRILRVARFFSYLYNLNFRINLHTFKLMKKISYSEELKYISIERVWIETKKAILTNYPTYYFKVLKLCKALYIILPEINNLINLSFDLNIKNIFNNYINKIFNLKLEINIRFSSILYIFYEHILFIQKSDKIKYIIKNNILNISKRLKLPNKLKKIINNLHLYYCLNVNINNLNFNKIIYYIHILNIYKNINNLEQFINISFINQDKKLIFIDINNISYTKEKLIRKICKLMNKISIKKIILDGYYNSLITKELIIRQKKIIIYELKNNYF